MTNRHGCLGLQRSAWLCVKRGRHSREILATRVPHWLREREKRTRPPLAAFPSFVSIAKILKFWVNVGHFSVVSRRLVSRTCLYLLGGLGLWTKIDPMVKT